MRAVDSNVLLRFLMHDDALQAQKAERLIKTGVFAADTVMLEVEWVLRGGFELSREQVGGLLDALVRMPNIDFADRAAIEEAVLLYRKGLDFGDAMHAATSFAHAKNLRTFDKSFVKDAKRAASRTDVEGV
jgi:predicted nucleic-acid-binding protein